MYSGLTANTRKLLAFGHTNSKASSMTCQSSRQISSLRKSNIATGSSKLKKPLPPAMSNGLVLGLVWPRTTKSLPRSPRSASFGRTAAVVHCFGLIPLTNRRLFTVVVFGKTSGCQNKTEVIFGAVARSSRVCISISFSVITVCCCVQHTEHRLWKYCLMNYLPVELSDIYILHSLEHAYSLRLPACVYVWLCLSIMTRPTRNACRSGNTD
jgi:hypothetical protein